jgi:hypothetical protein
MTRSTSQERTARQLATTVRDLLRALMALSVRQMEAIERDDLDQALLVAEQKEALLQLLPGGVERFRQQGWNVHQPATWPPSGPCAPLVREVGDLARRLQAHERYVMGQMVIRKSRIADRLNIIMQKRHAAAGYHVPSTSGHAIDTAR